MRMKKNRRPFILALVSLPLVAASRSVKAQSRMHDGFRGGFREALGPKFDPPDQFETAQQREKPPSESDLSVNRLRYWNEIALQTNGLDHTPVAPGETRVFGEQFGPALVLQL